MNTISPSARLFTPSAVSPAPISAIRHRWRPARSSAWSCLLVPGMPRVLPASITKVAVLSGAASAGGTALVFPSAAYKSLAAPIHVARWRAVWQGGHVPKRSACNCAASATSRLGPSTSGKRARSQGPASTSGFDDRSIADTAGTLDRAATLHFAEPPRRPLLAAVQPCMSPRPPRQLFFSGHLWRAAPSGRIDPAAKGALHLMTKALTARQTASSRHVTDRLHLLVRQTWA